MWKGWVTQLTLLMLYIDMWHYVIVLFFLFLGGNCTIRVLLEQLYVAYRQLRKKNRMLLVYFILAI